MELSVVLNENSVVKFLNNKGYNAYDNAELRAKIADWDLWYRGYVESFHVHHVSNGVNVAKKELFALKMGKRVCEDWVSLTTLKDSHLVVNSTNTKSNVFVQGSKGTTGVLGSNNFNTLFNTYLESMYALGTCAFTVDVTNLEVYINSVAVNKETKVIINGYTAHEIYPITYRNGVVTECAFSKKYVINGREITLIQIHELDERNNYVIKTEGMDNSGSPVPLPEGIIPVFNTHSPTPLFTILKTSVANNIDINSPMGISIFADAISTLKGVDICYNATIADIESGQRLILMDRRLLSTDMYGNVIPPQDAKQYYFQFIGNELNTEDSPMVTEFTPKLNAEELDKELNNQLSLLGFKCGLGSNYYSFTNGVVTKTATEVLYSKKDERDNVDKQMLAIQEGIISIVKGILAVGSNLGIANVDPNAKVTFETNDGLINSDLEERQADREDVKLGLMGIWEYRMKWYGEDEATARAKEVEIKGNNPITINGNEVVDKSMGM